VGEECKRKGFDTNFNEKSDCEKMRRKRFTMNLNERGEVELRVGQRAGLEKTFTQDDFNRFAILSGDDNPIHVDEAFSARTYFGKPVAHGMLLYSIISSLLGKQLPGPGSWQMEQELVFPSPTFAGEPVTFAVEITGIQGENLAELTTHVTRTTGEAGATGSAIVRLPGKVALPASETAHPASPHKKDMTGSGQEIRLKGLCLGQKASVQRTYTHSDMDDYAELTGDTNPLFNDSRFAQVNGFEGAIVPGPLLGALFSFLLGTRLPGRGTNWLKQRLSFKRPAYPLEEITALVEVVRLRPEKNLVNLRTTCQDPTGALVCDGEALVAVRDLLSGDEQDRE
jgi:acyl dehydratase